MYPFLNYKKHHIIHHPFFYAYRFEILKNLDEDYKLVMKVKDKLLNEIKTNTNELMKLDYIYFNKKA